MQKQLTEAKSISSAESREMIEMFTQAGEHHLAFRFRSPDDVVACFKQNGYDFAAVVEECRDPRRGVPMFENLPAVRGPSAEVTSSSRTFTSTEQHNSEQSRS